MGGAMSPDRDHLGRKLSTLRLCALFHRTIILRCTRCGHSRKLDAIALWWLFERKRWDDDLREARRRFYCPRCGRSRRPTLTVSEEPPEGEQPPYPDEREWKRLKSRFRC
jgi:hypothetical protein